METLPMDIDTIAHVINIAVAPVFLLAGISGLLMVLTNRLARTIDRSRALQAATTRQILPEYENIVAREMGHLLKRSRFINLAINLATTSALMVCFVIIALFLGSLARINVALIIASLFIICMLFLVMALFCFFMEVFIATRRLQASLMSPESFSNIDT